MKTTTYTLQEIAHFLNGEVVGNHTVLITHPCTIQNGTPGGISFLANPKYGKYLPTTGASAVVVGRQQPLPPLSSTTLIVVEDPYSSFGRLLVKFRAASHREKATIEFPSYIGQHTRVGKGIYRGAFSYIGDYVKIGENVKIYPQAYIGDHTVIGDDTIIYSGVKVYAHSTIGSGCIIHAGAVIGSDGFSLAPRPGGDYEKIPSLGNVILEDEVEIGANTTIDAATIEATCIQKGVKIDNLVQVAHNVTIGQNTAIAAQVGIAGSTQIGSQCKLAGQVGISGHIEIGQGTTVLAQAGVSKSFPRKNNLLSGAPAFDNRKFLVCYAYFRQLPDIVKKLVESKAARKGE